MHEETDHWCALVSTVLKTWSSKMGYEYLQ